MSKKQKTYVAIIIDSSGSMSETAAETVGGYNEHVQQMKNDAKDQEIYLSLVTFNGSVYEHIWNEPIENLEEANVNDFHPYGSTAMRDAIGYTIKKLKKTVVEDENTAFLIIVISDGKENASHHIGVNELKEDVQSLQNKGNWTFTYMGCDKKYLQQVARETAIPISNMATWSNCDSVAVSYAMDTSVDKLNSYFASRSQGVASLARCYCSSDATKSASYIPEENTQNLDSVDKIVGEAKKATQPINDVMAVNDLSQNVDNWAKITAIPPAVGNYSSIASSYAPTPFITKSAGSGVFNTNSGPVEWDE